MNWNETSIEDYKKSIFERRNEGAVATRIEMVSGDWEPKPNECHQNVTDLCEAKANLTPVRGWLYFDFSALGYAKFVAHSLVLDELGRHLDVTPNHASQDYPFVTSELSERDYADLIEKHGLGGFTWKTN